MAMADTAIATSSILVLDGEQHLRDPHANGSAENIRIRRKGDYGLSLGIETPHMECGVENGVLYELLDTDLSLIVPITIEMLVAHWQQNT